MKVIATLTACYLPPLMPLIIVENLVKKFDEFSAVNGINFSVKHSESFELLGNVAYFLGMIFAGLFFTTRRLNA